MSSVADIFLQAQFIRRLKDNGIREHLLQNKFSEKLQNMIQMNLLIKQVSQHRKKSIKFQEERPSTAINVIISKRKTNRNTSQMLALNHWILTVFVSDMVKTTIMRWYLLIKSKMFITIVL